MRSYIERRVRDEAEYIVRRRATVRDCAGATGISKSTVWKDMTDRLPLLDEALYKRVREVFGVNLDERHLRGGSATREKYRKRHEHVNIDSV